MRVEDQGKLLRVYVDEGAKHGGKLLYEAVVQHCHDRGMAGATVLRGVQGYGANLRIRKTGVLRLSADLPMLIEVADTADKIDALLPEIEAMIGNGLITVEKVRMIRLTSEGED
jgi:uncharacterized protein